MRGKGVGVVALMAILSTGAAQAQDRTQKFAGAAAEKKSESQARSDEAKLRAKAWADGRMEDVEGWKKFGKQRADKSKQWGNQQGDKMMDVNGIDEGVDEQGHRRLQPFRPGATIATIAHQGVGLEKGAFTVGRRMVGKLSTNFGGLLTGSSWTVYPRLMSGEDHEEGRKLGAEQPCPEKNTPTDDRVWSLKPFAAGQAARVQAKDSMDDRWGRYQRVGEFESNYFTQWAIARGWIPEASANQGQPQGQGQGRRLDAMDDRMADYKEKGEWWAEFGKKRAEDAKVNAQENGYMHEEKNKNKKQKQQGMEAQGMAAATDEDKDLAMLSGYFTGNLGDETVKAPENMKRKQQRQAAKNKAEASIDPSGNQQPLKPMMMPPDDVHDGKKFR